MHYTYRIGADENGLGARLGPLVVTAVLARIEEGAHRVVDRKPSRSLAQDLDDSKKLVNHGNVALGEAWARAILGAGARTPAELFAKLSFEGPSKLREPCPEHIEAQCWTVTGETFVAEEQMVQRLRRHLARLEKRGVTVLTAQCSVLCTKALNDARSSGKNRFVTDLHAMEHLVLGLREQAGSDVLAVCGKVGGIDDYSKFFGPLSRRLHAIVDQGKALSAYQFPGLGQVRFVRDADGSDPLVMLASLVGKYVRELLMARITRFYRTAVPELAAASGYHDPTTSRFVRSTASLRNQRGVTDVCFERARDGGAE